MGFDLGRYLAEQKARVEALLDARAQLIAEHTPPALYEAIRYSLLDGGKRLRPILVFAFAEACTRTSGGGGMLAEDAACAVEYIHTYSLIHDDLPAMDDDDLRRGRPTSHVKFGEAMAILAGDALLTEAFGLLAMGVPLKPNFQQHVMMRPLDEGPSDWRARMVGILAEAAGARGMVGGQVLDIAEDRPAQEGYLVRMHRLKTGALIRASCLLGALAASGAEQHMKAASAYGEAVGLAFQIADDILDVTQSAEAMGKPTGADAAAGRHTFPAVLGLEPSRSLARQRVEQAIAAVKELEPEPGPLAALARYAVERVV